MGCVIFRLHPMMIGDRLRHIRREKRMSQGDMAKRAGLLRCYLSRVENGHTVPSVRTLERIARALEIPMYQLFYQGEGLNDVPLIAPFKIQDGEWGINGEDARVFQRLRRLLGKISERDQGLLLAFASKAAQQQKNTTDRNQANAESEED